MRISVLKGPLNRDLLQAIARLYGSHDQKYSSVDFCDVIFNRNPSGYSFHSFAHDGDRIIGHYAVVPIGIIARGKTELSGKGEALFLEEGYRSELVREGNAEIPLGIALAVCLYRFVLQHGVKVIHVIADDTIGVIHRMAGCKRERVERKRSVFLLQARKLLGSRERLTQLWALRPVLFVQRMLSLLSKLILLFLPKPAMQEAPQMDSSGSLLQRMVVSQDRETPGDKWTIVRDMAHLSWFFQTGLLRVYTVSDSPDDYVVVRESSEPGGDTEIVDCSVAGKRILSIIRLMSHVISEARRRNAARVTFSSWLPGEGGKTVSRAGRLFGFVSRVERTSFYLKSEDPFFLRGENIALTPFFYGTF